jgi:hypothetical protein
MLGLVDYSSDEDEKKTNSGPNSAEKKETNSNAMNTGKIYIKTEIE